MDASEAGPKRTRTWWIVALGIVSAWCLYLYFFGPRPSLNIPVLEGTALKQPADFNWAPSDLDGRPVPFERYRGKPVFLNVWATWCPPCVAELPSIARLAGARGLDPVAFVCVSIDPDIEAVRRFVKGKDWPMTVLHVDPGALPEVFTTEGIPATFLIAPDGRITASALGSAEWDDPSAVAFLQKMASVKPGAGAVTQPEEEPSAPAASR
jgi:thiol-disulfide isomerase/thioredoxin